MEKVEIVLNGCRALVPANKAKTILRKAELVKEALALQDAIKNTTSDNTKVILQCSLDKIMGKIISANRRIGPCVQFI